MSLTDFNIERNDNPVDLAEQIASAQDWSFERSDEDEITITVAGSWADYSLSLSWMSDMEALHLASAFDLKVGDQRKPEIVRLLAFVNEQLWIGHFDLWQVEGMIMYRNTLLLTEGAEPTVGQLASLLSAAVDACERYYQAFQFVTWAGKSAEDALAAVLFETAGEA